MEITSCDLITKQRNVKTQFSEIHVPKTIVLQSQTSDAAFGFDLIFFYLGHTYTTIKKEKNISTIKLSDNEKNCQLSSARTASEVPHFWDAVQRTPKFKEWTLVITVLSILKWV